MNNEFNTFKMYNLLHVHLDPLSFLNINQKYIVYHSCFIGGIAYPRLEGKLQIHWESSQSALCVLHKETSVDKGNKMGESTRD